MVQTLDSMLEEAQKQIKAMSCEDYEDARDRKVDHVLLDVRTKEEFLEGHIPGALNIPRGKLEFVITESVPNRNTPIMICCGTGKRAMLAAQTLGDMGYSDVRVLEGGYKGFCELNGSV